ncbi:MAG TPA: efflux RND transporter periplasmic adaptor subunit [Hyphomicrobiaceae bacterium]|nr:efflux RND transporter periplasmic adaptor subunit [Hyphomicrobiaceae bacterium]
MTRRLGYLFTLAIPLVAAGLVATWLLGLTPTSGDGFVYDTAHVEKGAIRKLVTTSGPVRALVTVSVGSQLSGQVDEVKVDFNSEVKPGDVLATIDAKTFAAKVAQAKADLAVAIAARANQEAALVKAEAVLKLAGRNIDRQTTLAAKGFAAQSALDSATRDSEVAKADITVSKAQITSAEATIKQRQAALDQAQIDLDRTEIRSPIDGTVISRTVDPGQTVAASLQSPELFKIAQDLSRIRIEAQVNEADVGSVAEGNLVTFTVDAYPDRQFDGRVTQVRLAATELNNVVTYTVIAEAANEDRKLFPGMTANVSIESAKREGVLRVTNDAFRFKPRNGAAAGAERHREGGGGDRSGRMVERLKGEINLTPPQEQALIAAMAALGEERRESGQGLLGSTPANAPADRQRMRSRIEQALSPLLTDEQRPLFEKWKKDREAMRSATLWVLGAGRNPERRFVRTGLADDQFTEILGGLEEGDNVVVRAREAKS